MIIAVLDQKYKIGSGRGISAIEKPGLLQKLNLIIEWDLCKFPKKEVGKKEEEVDVLDDEGNPTGEKTKREVPILEEDKKFLGEEPELKPGNCFFYNGQVIGIDTEERLVLLVTETGPLAIQRLWDDVIEPELTIVYNDSPVDKVTWELIEEKDLPQEIELEEKRIAYKYWEIWRERFVKGRLDGNFKTPIKCTIDSEDFLLPITVYLKPWSFLYSPEDMVDDKMTEEVIMQILSWFIENYDRAEKPTFDE